MPFKIEDVERHNRGLSDAKKAQWVAVANSVLKKCIDDGGDDASCAPKAIRQANGVVAVHEDVQVDYNPCHNPSGPGGGQFCGGNVESSYPKTVDEIKSTQYGKGFFIAPDGDLIDISSEFGGGTNDHVGTIGMDKYAKKLGLPQEDISKMEKIVDKLNKMGDTFSSKFEKLSDKQNEMATNMMLKAFEKGALRVRLFKGVVAIEGHNIALSKIQNLLGDNKIPSDRKALYMIEGAAGRGAWGVQTNLSNLLLSNRWNEITTNMAVHLNANANYTIRKEFLQGKEHIIVPIIMMREGVHSGSHGPILHLAEELGKFPGAWDGIPVSIQHPQEDGMHVSANQPHILDEFVVGRVFNTMMDGQKLKAEAWLDPVVLKNISPEAMEYIMEGKPLEVSVGVFTDEDIRAGDYEGKHYEAVARNHRPDHLALLPGAVGACSWSDGCGVRTHQEGLDTNTRHEPTYNSWRNMIQRCTNPNSPDYKYYGKKGVKVVQRWLDSFDNFLEDMGQRPEGKTINRKNRKGDYSKQNCEWATSKKQNNRENHSYGEPSMQTNAIKFEAIESIPWTKSTLADFGKGSNWSTMDTADKSDIANHFLIGDDAAANFGELMFPVVNPKSGKLNEQALRAVIGGRGAQANITSAQRISARRQAYRLLNSEFDAKLDVPSTLAADIAVHEDGGLKELARLGFSINEIGAQNQQDIEDTWGSNTYKREAVLSAALGALNVSQKSLDLGAKRATERVYNATRLARTSQDHRQASMAHKDAGQAHRKSGGGAKEAIPFHRTAERLHGELARSMGMTGFSINEIGYSELRNIIQAKLDRMDDDAKAHYLEDIYDGYIIYRVEPRGQDRPVSLETKNLFKRNYTAADDGTVEFTGESMPVIKRVSYDPASQRGGMNNMADKPCCEAKVQMLIESGAYAETDRDRLLTMEEADIDVLAAGVTAKAALQTKIDEMAAEMKAMKDKLATMQSNADTQTTRDKAIEVLKEDLGDKDKFLALAPKEIRSTLEHGLRLHQEERSRQITHIMANTNEGVYTKGRLEAMDDQDLSFLAQAIKAPVDYSGQAPTPQVNRGSHEAQAVYPPGVE